MPAICNSWILTWKPTVTYFVDEDAALRGVAVLILNKPDPPFGRQRKYDILKGLFSSLTYQQFPTPPLWGFEIKHVDQMPAGAPFDQNPYSVEFAAAFKKTFGGEFHGLMSLKAIRPGLFDLPEAEYA